MSADIVSLEQIDRAIRKHSASANRFYSDLAGKTLAGSVSNLSLLSPEDLKGEEVLVHGHAPASRAAHRAAHLGDLPRPVNVFSVLDRSRRVLGQVTDLALSDPGGAVDRSQLAAHLENPAAGKTRNTFITGIAAGPAPRRRPLGAEALNIRPGRVFVPGEGDLWTASLEPGAPTRSPVLGRRAAVGAGTTPDRPTAWIVR